MLTGFFSHLPHWYKVEKYEESSFNKNVLQYIFHTVCSKSFRKNGAIHAFLVELGGLAEIELVVGFTVSAQPVEATALPLGHLQGHRWPFPSHGCALSGTVPHTEKHSCICPMQWAGKKKQTLSKMAQVF